MDDPLTLEGDILMRALETHRKYILTHNCPNYQTTEYNLKQRRI